MLSSISWPQYFSYLVIGIAAYYVFIWLVFFKGRLSLAMPKHSFRQMGEDAPDEILSASQHVMDELRPVFNGRTNKAELLMAIRQTLQKYQEWDEPGFRTILTDFITQESQSKCSIRLGEEDQRALWK